MSIPCLPYTPHGLSPCPRKTRWENNLNISKESHTIAYTMQLSNEQSSAESAVTLSDELNTEVMNTSASR